MESRKAREQKGESGYSWLYRSAVFHSGTRVTMTILVIVLAAAFFAWYTHTNDDAAPDSLVGLIYAFIGTTLLLFEFAVAAGLSPAIDALMWRGRYATLTQFLETLETRPSFVATSPQPMDVDLQATVR